MTDPSHIPQAGAEAARLRADIDSGRTGDKISVSDPAASPLGTDDEAAGVTNTAADIAAVRKDSVKTAPQIAPESAPVDAVSRHWPWIAVGVVAVLALGVAFIAG